MNFQRFKLDLEKAEEPEIKLPTSVGSSKKWKLQKNIYFCFIDYTKAFDCVDHNKLWKILKEMGIPDHLTCLLRNMHVKKQQLEPYMVQVNGLRLRKQYDRAVCCHPVCLIYMLSIWGTISHQSEWLWSKSLQAINAGECVEKGEPSYTVGLTVKGQNFVE